VALKGLRLTLLNPVSGVVVVDSEAEFNLTVVDGPSDMQYMMAYDDGAGATPYNESSMLRETFSVPGEYVVTATANDTNATVCIQAWQTASLIPIINMFARLTTCFRPTTFSAIFTARPHRSQCRPL